MPRPFKNRRIDNAGEYCYFKPQGVPMRHLDEVQLTLDEMEAIKLADLEGLYQADAAEKMNVSRQTFGNIVKSARQKLADALINGKAVRVAGGHVEISEESVCGRRGMRFRGGRGE